MKKDRNSRKEFMGLAIAIAVIAVGVLIWPIASMFVEKSARKLKMKVLPVKTQPVERVFVSTGNPPAEPEPGSEPIGPQHEEQPPKAETSHVAVAMQTGVVASVAAATQAEAAAVSPLPGMTNSTTVQATDQAAATTNAVARQVNFPTRYDCVALLDGETLVFWGNKNQYGAIRIDRVHSDGAADYTTWNLLPRDDFGGTFADSIVTNGTVRLPEPAGAKKVEDAAAPVIRCGDTEFGWLGPVGIIVPRSFSVAVVTNENMKSLDLLAVEWSTFPFYLNIRR